MTNAINVTRKFLESKWYPIFIGAMVFLSHVFSLEIIAASIIVLSCASVFLLCDSTEYVMTPLISFAFLLSVKNTPAYPSYSDFFKKPAPIITIAVLSLLLLASAIWFFIRTGNYKRIKIKKEPVFVSLSVFILTFFVSALFTGEYIKDNLIFAAAQTAAIFVPFVILHFGIKKDRTRGVLIDKLCYAVLISVLVVVLELVYLYITEERIFKDGSVDKHWVMLGWGISNCIGGVLSMGIPFLILGAQRSKHTVPYFLAAVVAYVSTVMTLSRNAVLIGTVIFAACCITCCFFGKKKREFRLITLTLIVIFAVFALIFHEKILEILDHYVRKGLDDSGRFTIWKESFDAFLGNVLVGGGFHGFDASYSSVAMFMPELPHNTPLALLGGGGLLMFGSYCVHRFYTLCPFIKRPTLEKTLLLLAVLTLIGESLLDNFFFNFYPTFAYTAAICVVLRAEKTE